MKPLPLPGHLGNSFAFGAFILMFQDLLKVYVAYLLVYLLTF